MVPYSFAGHDLRLLPQNAVFWPAHRALIVADLHLEKASWFARAGQMLPPFDSVATLADLSALSVATGACELWCLGDNFHDHDGPSRLTAHARAVLDGLMTTIRVVWVTGNHDATLDHPGLGEVVEQMVVDGLVLRHRADPLDSRPELSGHFHPKIRVSGRGGSVSRRCFVASDTRLILPAFGSLTGGLDARHPEIVSAAGRNASALVPAAGKLLTFPLAQSVNA
jgi:uncharacterized protein